VTSFQLLFEHSAAVALEQQWALSKLIGDHDWWLDLDGGTITFGEQTFSVQVLGSESDSSETWLWAWANTQLDIPTHLLTAVRSMYEYGIREGVPEFTTGQLDLKQVTGHQLALVASRLCHADCYYRGPYDGGAVFVLIEAPLLRTSTGSTPLHMVNVFQQLISLFPFNHRRTFLAYCQQKGYQCMLQNETIIAQHHNGAELRAHFDIADRLLTLTTTVGG
jgi:hypothetical protein